MLVWLITSACLFFGTSFHNLGHRNASSRFLRAAQQLHLVITPQHHWVHHRRDQTVRYCVINGWANYPCDLLRFWRGLEWLVHALTGAAPRRDDLEWQRRYREPADRRSRAHAANFDQKKSTTPKGALTLEAGHGETDRTARRLGGLDQRRAVAGVSGNAEQHGEAGQIPKSHQGRPVPVGPGVETTAVARAAVLACRTIERFSRAGETPRSG